MAKSQEDGITILLGLKGHEVGKVSENGEEIMVEVRVGLRGINCPRCGSMRLYRHGLCQRGKVLHSWSGAIGFTPLVYSYGVCLKLHRHRWRCRECSRSFNDRAELLRPYSRLTRQAEQEAL